MTGRSLWLVSFGLVVALTGPALAAEVEPPLRVAAPEALRITRARAPELRTARARLDVARTEIDVAGVLANPTFASGTSTQAARLSVTAGVPLPVFGQRGAAVAASRADAETVRVESEMTWVDVRANAARAYVELWLAQERAAARAEGSVIAARIDGAVATRVQLGASPEMDGLRTRSEKLRAEADAREAEAFVDAASSRLGFFLGTEHSLRADGEYSVPGALPTLEGLAARLDKSPPVRRENADARAADARASRERALVRPTPVLELGADVGDPTQPAVNVRGQLAIEIPLLSLRGPQIERERALAGAARSRAYTESQRARSSLAAAYATLIGTSARAKTLRDGALVAAEAAARAAEESYALGRAQLVAILDAARSRLETRIALAEALATRAQAWIEIERLLGSS